METTAVFNSFIMNKEDFSARLKQICLLFDSITVPLLDVVTGLTNVANEIQMDMEFLKQNGILIEMDLRQVFSDIEATHPELAGLVEDLDSGIERTGPLPETIKLVTLTDAAVWKSIEIRDGMGGRGFSQMVDGYNQILDGFSRVIAQGLKLKNLNASPILSKNIYSINEKATNADVVQILVNQMPLPKLDTPWERILEFRDNPASRRRLLALRNWSIDISTTLLTPIEVTQKLEHLVEEYRAALQLHEISTNLGFFETFVKTSTEFAENLVKIRLAKMAKGLFVIRERQVALLKAELSAPGREIAHIVAAHREFGT